MVSSDAAAWCVCRWNFRSTNKMYLHFTQKFLYIFHKAMQNTIIEFSVCDIRDNQGLGKCNQARLESSADYTYQDLKQDKLMVALNSRK